jgi:hypothetical protein
MTAGNGCSWDMCDVVRGAKRGSAGLTSASAAADVWYAEGLLNRVAELRSVPGRGSGCTMIDAVRSHDEERRRATVLAV